MSTSHESALDPASQVTLIEQAKAAAEIAAGIKQAFEAVPSTSAGVGLLALTNRAGHPEAHRLAALLHFPAQHMMS